MENLDSFMDKLYENSTIDYVECSNGATVLIPKEIERVVENKNGKPETGFLFERNLKVEDFKEVVSKLNPTSSEKIYEASFKNVGYDFIKERKEIVKYKKLIEYKEDKVDVEGTEINRAILPNQMEDFSTDILSLNLRKLNTEQAKDNYPDFVDEAREGNLFILEDAHPGRTWINGREIPPFSQWKSEYFVVSPQELNKETS